LYKKEITNRMELYAKYIDQLCKKYAENNSLVFDCGCGDGFHTSIIKKYCSEVIGGDFDNRMDEKYGIPFRKIDVNNCGQENEFNATTAFDVIEHVENDQSFLAELIKVTKSGGIIMIGTPNRNRLSNKIVSCVKGEIVYPCKIGYHFESGGDIIHLREYTEKDLENMAKKMGNVEIIKIYTSFLGLYIPKIGPVGFRGMDIKILKNYCQHLFLVLRKK
jgi:SAM-dependent methyltransferase